MTDFSAPHKQPVDILKERLVRVENGDVWDSDHPGPYTPDEKAKEIERIKALIQIEEQGMGLSQKDVTSVPPPPRPPLPPFGGNTMDEANRIAVQTAADLRRRSIANNNTISAPPIVMAGTSSLTVNADVIRARPDEIVGSMAAIEGTDRSTFANRVSERPADIRDAARLLATMIQDQIEDLKPPPHGVNDLRKHDELLHFLVSIAAGLRELADALDRLVDAKAKGQKEPIFLGEAGKIAQRLSTEVIKWLEDHGTEIVDFSMKIGLVAAGYNFLHVCGVDHLTAGVVSGLLSRCFSKAKQKNKGSH